MLFIDIKDNDEPKVINHKCIITKPPSFSHYDLILNELLLGNIISNHCKIFFFFGEILIESKTFRHLPNEVS